MEKGWSDFGRELCLWDPTYWGNTSKLIENPLKFTPCLMPSGAAGLPQLAWLPGWKQTDLVPSTKIKETRLEVCWPFFPIYWVYFDDVVYNQTTDNYYWKQNSCRHGEAGGGELFVKEKKKSLNVIYFCYISKAEVRRDRVKIPFFGHLCVSQHLGKSKIKRKESKTRSPKDGPFVYIFFPELQSSR